MPHYIVMEIADEYNDEIYELQSGGEPVAVFTTKKAAEADRTQRQIKKMIGVNPGDYTYDRVDLSRLDFLRDLDVDDFTIPAGLTDAQYMQITRQIDCINFFHVVEVN